MRILVLSDTHGDNSRAYQVFDKLKKEAPVDLIIHCGDYYKDAIQMSERTGCPMVWVKGNTDGAFSDNDYTICWSPTATWKTWTSASRICTTRPWKKTVSVPSTATLTVLPSPK